jgi:hypothetical protein
MSLIVISSELEELIAYSSRIFVLRDREHVAELTGENVSTSRIVTGDCRRAEKDGGRMTSSQKALLIRLAPQLIALGAILLLNFIMFPQFFNVTIQNGRFYGSFIDVLNRGAPVALLATGMTLVIATKGIDLSVGAVIAICGAVAASSIVSGNSLAGRCC